MFDYLTTSSAGMSYQYGPTVVASPTSYAPYHGGQMDFRPVSPAEGIWTSSGEYSWDPSYQNTAASDASAVASPEPLQQDSRSGKRKEAPSPRKRISRACDQCNQLRTKCDGEKPCAHCISFGLVCEYKRERKKRGKVSRKDLQLQQALTAAAASLPRSNTGLSPQSCTSLTGAQSSTDPYEPGAMLGGRKMDHLSPSPTGYSSASTGSSLSILPEKPGGSMDSYASVEGLAAVPIGPGNGDIVNHAGSASSEHGHLSSGVNRAASMDCVSCSSDVHPSDSESNMDYHGPLYAAGAMGSAPDGDVSHPCETLGPCVHLKPAGIETVQSGRPRTAQRLTVTTSQPAVQRSLASPYGSGFTEISSASCSMPSPALSTCHYSQLDDSIRGLRFPVLQPLLPHLPSTITPSMACDMLEGFFTEFARAGVHPLSPYLLGYVLRKESILHAVQPRVCSPALLASMLWVVARSHSKGSRPAQTSEQKSLCHDLLDLTLTLLNLRISDPSRATMSGSATPISGSVFTQDGATLASGGGARYLNPAGPPAVVDDIATYINLAVMSARESPNQSLPWWKAAWSLARDEKIHLEIPYGPTVHQIHQPVVTLGPGDLHAGLQASGYLQTHSGGPPAATLSAPPSPSIQIKLEPSSDNASWLMGEEQREERRRVWWLLYIMDRHMALCCERPLFFSDHEGDALLQPMDEARWRSGALGDRHSETAQLQKSSSSHAPATPSIYTNFLPLVSLVGKALQPPATTTRSGPGQVPGPR